MYKLFFLVFLNIFSISVFGKENIKVDNLVEPASYFVNHGSQMQTLDNQLSLFGKVGIVGMSGIGKTQLARMFAFKNKNKYDLIWFFDCNVDLNEQFVELAKAINKTSYINRDLPVSESLIDAKLSVMSFLTSKKKWLIVFDNIKVNQNSKVSEFVEWENNGHVIFCSQDSEMFVQTIPLNNLSRQEAITLVNNIMDKTKDDMVEELVEEFKGYPLLVAQGAIYLNSNKHMSVQEYKKTLKKSDNKIASHLKQVLSSLKPSAQELLIKIAVLNNQKFSLGLLNSLTINQASLMEDIHSLTRFGIINNITQHDQKKQIFEIHDTIKDTLMEYYGFDEIHDATTKVVDAFNKFMPKGVSSRYLAITQDETILSNLEVLLNNAEKFNVSIHKRLELRKNLVDYYMSSLDYYNCQKMSDWLSLKETTHSFNLATMDDEEKSFYCWYLANIGIYEHFAKSDYLKSIEYLTKALHIMRGVDGYPELKFTIYAQLTQTYLYSGRVQQAKEYLQYVDNVVTTYNQADLDLGLYWFLKAKLSLLEGKYDNALLYINKNIEVEKHLPQDTFTAGTYILKAEILNYLGNFVEAYEISKRIYEQEKAAINGDHEIHARILVQLSRAQNGMKQFKVSLESAMKAKDIFLKEEKRLNKDINLSHNIELAAALVAEGNALSNNDKLDIAMESYASAEAIYYNTYREHMKEIDEVSYLYYMAAKSAQNLKDKFWFDKFKNQLKNKFGENHLRMQELLKPSS